MRKKYIQVNPPWLRSWIVMDVDRPGAALSWEDALPMPAWSSMNPINGHAHLAWGIEAPVLLGRHDRQRPMRYLAAVESAMRAKLAADPGYSGLVTKNPLHSQWRTLWAPPGAGIYDLRYLSDWLDLPKHAPRARPERVGLGRNVDTFDYLRHRAYREIRAWRQASGPGSYVFWLKHLYDAALAYTGQEHPHPLDARECHHIARSVAHWVWTKFDLETSDARFAARQARRGQASGQARRAASEDKRISARLMSARGMTQRSIADELGVHQSTVARWLQQS